MILFSSPIDRAADRYVKAHFAVSEAKRQRCGLQAARTELRRAEAHWQVVCSDVMRAARPKPYTKILPAKKFKRPV